MKQRLIERAREADKRIVFPEGGDIRVIRAAYDISARGMGRPILIVDPEHFEALRREHGLKEPDFHVASLDQNADKYTDLFAQKRAKKGITPDEAARVSADPLFKAALMVACGDADTCVGGAVRTTADTVRAAIQSIGTAKGTKTVSSFFLMILPDDRVLLYSDCGVIPFPTSQQLADITRASAKSWRQLTGEDPKVAMLSFSTHGSAKDESIDTILSALEMVRNAEPDLAVDGELQADAALVPAIGAKKAPGSSVAGEANVLIFPNLHAGNIAYKLTERLAGATALGPILQGLARPMNDLSRGCNSEDILLVSAISAIQCD